MTRPTQVKINTTALLHNLERVKAFAPGKKIVAMVKANAYGCGLSTIAPHLDGKVAAFGVACLAEALYIKKLGCVTPCILFQGVFSAEELHEVAFHQFQCVIHQAKQLEWILNTPLKQKIKIWLKVNTGMNRIGLKPDKILETVSALKKCEWVEPNISILSHLACADEPEHPMNRSQLDLFQEITQKNLFIEKSLSNSAAIIALSATHFDVIRPGIMLYGVSPFADQTAQSLGLKPVMTFVSAISAIHDYPAQTPVGYHAAWQSQKPTKIGVVAVGYGDGYPRHINGDAKVWIKGQLAPIVGRVSMDMITIDLSHLSSVEIGESVELWGVNLPIELAAKASHTSPYELLCQISNRARGD